MRICSKAKELRLLFFFFRMNWDYLECVKPWKYVKSSYILHSFKKGNKLTNKGKKEKEKGWRGWWCGSTGV